jgi:lysophospholipase L1-like esterase
MTPDLISVSVADFLWKAGIKKAGALSAATRSDDGKTFTGSGVKPGSSVVVLVNAASVATVTADASGNWTYTFTTAPAAGSVVGWDGTTTAPTLTVPQAATPPVSSLLDLHSRIVYFGDSITANRGFSGFADWCQFFSRGRYFGKAIGSNGLGPTGWNQGVVGNTTDQLIARIQNVLDEAPKVVFLLIGTNDIGASGRDATYITTRLRTIINTLIAAGIKVVVGTIIPRIAAGWGSTQNATKDAVNAWIKAQTDITVADTAAAITNAATQLMADGTHPNGLGAQPMGRVAATAISSLISTNDILYTLPTAPAENLFANPFFTGGTTTATSWTFFQGSNGLTKAASKTTLDGYDAQKIVWSGTSNAAVADNINQNVTPAGGIAGDLYEAWVEVQVNRFTGFRGLALAAGTNTSGFTAMSITAVDTVDQTAPFRGVLRAPPSALATNGGTLASRLSFVPANGVVCDAEVLILRSGFRRVPNGQ